jgi:hypothetical protein
MRFPVRFTSDFQLGVAARILRTRGRQPLILKLAPFSSGASDRFPTVESAPSMIWIGGAEPLEYPEISRYSNALAASGREVFLQTDGKLFRRRVHEFQPSSRFRLAFGFTGARFNAAENADVMEAIRIAKLSGFLTVGFTVLAAWDSIEDLNSLHAQLKKLDLDGTLILPTDQSPECGRTVSAARGRLLDGRWSNLSRLFGAATLPASVERVGEPANERAPHVPRRHASQPSAAADLEEGAQA